MDFIKGGIKIVKYTDIHKAIVTRLKSKFPDIDIMSRDIEEGITRPSFFVSFDNLNAADFMTETLDRNITVRLYYFSKNRDRNRIELLKMQDDLNDLFLQDNIIEIDANTKVEIEEAGTDIVDKVLHYYFDIRLSEDYDRSDNTPLMENIDYE